MERTENDVEISLPILSDGSLIINNDTVPAQSALETEPSSSPATHFVIINFGQDAPKSSIQSVPAVSACINANNGEPNLEQECSSVSGLAGSISNPSTTVLPAAAAHLPENIISFITQNGSTEGAPVTHLTILLRHAALGEIALGQ